MSDLSNNVAILSYLKDKMQKWRNISIVAIAVAILLFLKIVFGDSQFKGLEGDYIASIKISDTILEDDYRSEILDKVLKEDAIKAVIVNINSPGGGIVGSEILFNQLRKIAEKKPMVVLMGSIAASGGYMAAIASDHIIAHNGTLTGSIGVLLQSAEITDLANKMGVKLRTYKSAPLKASPSPFEKSNPLADQAIDESIKDSANFFFALVKQRRGEKLNKAEFARIFDGRVFTGRQALNAGLIDEIGDKESALNYLYKAHNIDDSLEVQEISVVKNEERILGKLFGFLPFFNQNNSFSSRNGLMTILSL